MLEPRFHDRVPLTSLPFLPMLEPTGGGSPSTVLQWTVSGSKSVSCVKGTWWRPESNVCPHLVRAVYYFIVIE